MIQDGRHSCCSQVTAEMNANSDSLDFVSSTLIVETTQLVKSAGKDTPYCDLSTRQMAGRSLLV